MNSGLNGVLFHEFLRRRDGMTFALAGGLWLHRHTYRGEPMAHLVSSDRDRLLAVGAVLGMRDEWLQFKSLKDPRSGKRIEAWHWDLRGPFLEEGLRRTGPKVAPGQIPPDRRRPLGAR